MNLQLSDMTILLYRPMPEAGRSGSGSQPELLDEVALVGTTQLVGDLQVGHFGVQQQLPGLPHP